MFGLKRIIGSWIIKFVAKKMLGEDDDLPKINPGGLGDIEKYKTSDGREIWEIDMDQYKTYKNRRKRIK